MKYKYRIFDIYLEIDDLFNLNHVLILFSYEKYLVCYVDLFRTFQLYVILSNDWVGDNIYLSYVQEIKQFNKPLNSDYSVHSIKDMQILLMEHYLWPEPKKKIAECLKNTDYINKFNDMKLMDFLQNPEMMAIVFDKVDNKMYYREVPLNVAIEQLVTNEYANKYKSCNDIIQFSQAVDAIGFYLDNEDCLRKNIFRKLTPIYNNGVRNVSFYPNEIKKMLLICEDTKLEYYHNKKQEILIQYLEYHTELYSK